MSSTPEGAVLKAVMAYLAARRVLAFRMQSGAAVQQNATGGKRFMRFGTLGMADVLAFPHVHTGEMNYTRDGEITYPYPLWLECKAGKGKQSEYQKSFQAQVEAEGHTYAVVRSIEDVKELLS